MSLIKFSIIINYKPITEMRTKLCIETLNLNYNLFSMVFHTFSKFFCLNIVFYVYLLHESFATKCLYTWHIPSPLSDACLVSNVPTPCNPLLPPSSLQKTLLTLKKRKKIKSWVTLWKESLLIFLWTQSLLRP